MTTSASPGLDRLRRAGLAFSEELAREYYLAYSGQKRSAELQPIYAKHGDAVGESALETALEGFREAAPNSEARRGARILLEWQVETQAGRLLAPVEEREIAWEASAMVVVPPARTIPYQRAAIEIANATDRTERLAIDRARADLIRRELAPIKRERLQREREFVESLDLATGYVETFETVSGIPLRALADECRAFLRDTQPIWDEIHPHRVKRDLKIPVDEATRADALALFRARDWDGYFPGSVMESAIRRQTSEMGVDLTANGRIVLDTGEREGKRSRAFCAPVRIPQEVYLVIRPHGGQSDWMTFLHELGHALHFANMRPDYPFEYRWVGDNSITEGYAMLFDHRLQDRNWLLRYTDLDGRKAGEFLRGRMYEELHYVRRYCAKLLYELELYGSETSWESLPDRYIEILGGATGYRYQRADAFVDLDPRFYAARYLRAWQLQALLAEALTERFDEDWWRNPRTGPWMTEQLFAEAQREMAQEMAQRVAGRALSFAPVQRAIERNLAA